MIQQRLESSAKKCTKFRWFFGVLENLVFSLRDLLTFTSRARLASILDTIQDFLCELDMKPCMQLWEIIIFHYTMPSSDVPFVKPVHRWHLRTFDVFSFCGGNPVILF